MMEKLDDLFSHMYGEKTERENQERITSNQQNAEKQLE